MSSVLIRNGAVMTPKGWLNPGYVLTQGDRILEINAGEPPAHAAARAEKVLDARGTAVLPGLVNAHTHLSQTFMRGLAGGRPLVRWLRELIWPLQGAMDVEELHLAALLGLVDNLRAGVTHVVNHHKMPKTPAYTDAVCQAAQQVGLRLTLARAWVDVGTNAESPESILADLERLFHERHTPGILEIANGPLATWRCSPETMRRTHQLAGQFGASTHIHVSESQDEVDMTLEQSGMRPVHWLESLGVLGRRCQVVHAVWVEEEEIALMAERGAEVVHCPVSNMVLGSGIAPVKRMLEAGVRLRLGTDGPASNDTQDLWETLKAAVGLARAKELDPTILPPAQALRLATSSDGLVAGAPADIIMVNVAHPRTQPLHDIDSALVLATHDRDVEMVMVGGRILMEEGRVLVLDEQALLEECVQTISLLREKAGLKDTK